MKMFDEKNVAIPEEIRGWGRELSFSETFSLLGIFQSRKPSSLHLCGEAPVFLKCAPWSSPSLQRNESFSLPWQIESMVTLLARIK